MSDVLDIARQHGVTVTVAADGASLDLHGPRPPDEVLAALRSERDPIIEYLQAQAAAESSTSPPEGAGDLPFALTRIGEWKAGFAQLRVHVPPVAGWDSTWWARCHTIITEFLESHHAHTAAEGGWSSLELFAVHSVTGQPCGALLQSDLSVTQVTSSFIRRIGGCAFWRTERQAAEGLVAIWDLHKDSDHLAGCSSHMRSEEDAVTN
jgi:hypothetical protein